MQVLRLMEAFRIEDVTAAVRDAIARGAIGFDAVKHLVLCRIERRPPRLDMTIYPYLPKSQCRDLRPGFTWTCSRGAAADRHPPNSRFITRRRSSSRRSCVSTTSWHANAPPRAQTIRSLRLAELELIERERRMVERRIKGAQFPAVKSLDSFDFAAIPRSTRPSCWSSPARRCDRRENIIAVGNPEPAS